MATKRPAKGETSPAPTGEASPLPPDGLAEDAGGYAPPPAPRPARRRAKSTRLEARIAPLGLEMIKRAAEIQGRSVSDFVVTAAQAAAEKTIRDMHVIELSLEDQRRMYEAYLNPPEPGPAWHDALEAHRRLISESR